MIEEKALAHWSSGKNFEVFSNGVKTSATGTSVQTLSPSRPYTKVDTNSEFTLCSFHSVFGHTNNNNNNNNDNKHITHLSFHYSQRQLRKTDRKCFERLCQPCPLRPAYNTSIFTLYFIQSTPFLWYLDITSCQNVKESSLTLSLKNKRGLQVLKTGNCFQITGNSLVSIIRGLPNIIANWCGSITVEQACDVLQQGKLLAFFIFIMLGPS